LIIVMAAQMRGFDPTPTGETIVFRAPSKKKISRT